MAHFYFDVCTNGVTVEDEDGVDLLNAATALLEAARTAAEMMRDRCADRAEPADVSIIVRNGEPGAGLHRESRPHNSIARMSQAHSSWTPVTGAPRYTGGRPALN